MKAIRIAPCYALPRCCNNHSQIAPLTYIRVAVLLIFVARSGVFAMPHSAFIKCIVRSVKDICPRTILILRYHTYIVNAFEAYQDFFIELTGPFLPHAVQTGLLSFS